MTILRLHYLLDTLIIATLISYNCVLSTDGGSQGTEGRGLQSNLEIPVSTSFESQILNTFKIKNFSATVTTTRHILLGWNLVLDNKASKKPNPKPNPRRVLQIYRVRSSGTENYEENKVVMNQRCNVDDNLSRKTATCEYSYFPMENCTNYMFILAKQHTANVTTVSIVENSATLEVTHDENYPVLLTWKIDCSAANYMNPVSVSFSTDAEYNFSVDATCNSTETFCELRLAKAQISHCIPHVIHVNKEKATLDVETYYAHAVHNLSVKVENEEIQLEWNEPICPLSPSPHASAFYTLIVYETNTQQNAYHSLIPSGCITGIRRRRLLTFNKNSSNGCPGLAAAFQFQSALKSCINYTINLIHPGKRSSTSLKSFGSLPFMLQSLKSKEEIQNLEIVDTSSNGFQLKWDIPVRCQNVKNVIIPITINNQMPISLSLSDTNTTCNDRTCVVNWEHRSNIVPCTNYSVQVGKDRARIITLPPGIPVVNAPRNSSFSGSVVEWRVPVDCRLFLSAPEGWSYLISPAETNCTEKSCRMVWWFQKKLEPCASRNVTLGLLHVTVNALPDVPDGVATDVSIRPEKQGNSDQRGTAVITWNRPLCQNSKILGWQILIRRVRSNTEVMKNISNLATRFEFEVKPCETYYIIIRTQYEDGSDRYSTRERTFEANCPNKFLVPITAIVILLLVAIIIAFVFRRIRRREEIKNPTEVNKTVSTTESRNRVASLSRSRLPSFNFNRISSNSRHSSIGNADDDLSTLPQMTKRPLLVRDLCSFDAGQARMEFFLINKLTEIEAKKLARTIAARPENKIKNRFLNTHPYDFNRVVLSHSEEHQNDSYINASFIPGFNETKNEYIAAQGPKENTVVDFWRMIWEQKVKLVAMVTSLDECGKKKCEKYWPDQGESVVYGDLKLELVTESVNSFYTTRNILITKSPDLLQEIQQFHFTAWPDFEIPEQPEQLIRFIEIVRREARQLNSPSPIVVHCSAGVGRTGTFIALDYLIQQVLITDVVDVPRTVRHLRRFRTSMVQSEAQYVFLYTCMAHYVKTRLSSNGGQS
ncbi:hypothetical protein GHT06_017896 [Daphnia sinensis]|uniref:protein-tyrosine-phosphatase n=1 Tax=Daphnia sinensis TaxID=1820382 RepID=A0AAD5KLS1_9CRUS|nr:hypothetical protein GHT06_017896 [Daphnia sinensis]